MTEACGTDVLRIAMDVGMVLGCSGVKLVIRNRKMSSI